MYRDQRSPSNSSLLGLPLELQKDIIDKLDAASRLTFRLSNQYFHSLIPRPSHAILVQAEKSQWAVRRSLYTCMDCLRLRPGRCFADAMKKGPKGRNGKEPHKRFCVDCGLKSTRGVTRYSPGAEIEVEGERYVLCKKCCKYRDRAGCRGSGLCEGCHGVTSSCVRLGRCMKGSILTSQKGRRGWNSSYDVDYDLPDGYDENFWECYDPAD